MEKQDIVKILMKRDHMTLDDAWRVIDETQEEIDYLLSGSDPLLYEAEDIIKYNLSLEPEFLEAFLKW